MGQSSKTKHYCLKSKLFKIITVIKLQLKDSSKFIYTSQKILDICRGTISHWATKKITNEIKTQEEKNFKKAIGQSYGNHELNSETVTSSR